MRGPARALRPGAAGPGLRRKKEAVAERAAAVLNAGGEVWAGDETTLRECPPLRAAWARRGQQAEVVISGRNARRVLHGLLNVATGERVRLLRERGRGPDCAAAVAELGRLRPGVPKLLAWDNAPPHHARAAREAAAGAGVEIAWLPFRSPELNPCEDLWRHLKAAVAANRAYPSVDEPAARAVAWLDALSPADALRLAALSSSKCDWLPTQAEHPLALAVHGRGVEEVRPVRQGFVDDLAAARLGGRAPHVEGVPGAHPDRRDLEAGLPEGAPLHLATSSEFRVPGSDELTTRNAELATRQK